MRKVVFYLPAFLNNCECEWTNTYVLYFVGFFMPDKTTAIIFFYFAHALRKVRGGDSYTGLKTVTLFYNLCNKLEGGHYHILAILY